MYYLNKLKVYCHLVLLIANLHHNNHDHLVIFFKFINDNQYNYLHFHHCIKNKLYHTLNINHLMNHNNHYPLYNNAYYNSNIPHPHQNIFYRTKDYCNQSSCYHFRKYHKQNHISNIQVRLLN